MTLEGGSQIGPYTIEREIGRGGMGVVYLARDTRLDRDVAIKSLPEHLASEPERLARFEREARTLASLSHANVAGIYGVEERDGARYLILEYVEGETLADRLDRGALPADEAIELAVQIASGVEAAHEAGIIHRDLKPANIKITPEGVVKVLDFGLARADEGSSSSSSVSQLPTLTSPGANSPTVEGVILGTAAYMSPEQARGRKVDKRSDIWSFGVVVYEMLLGSSPFVGETVSDSIGAILHKDIDLARLPKSTPMGVRRVLERCLERDRGQRYRDIGDVRIELEHGHESGAGEGAGASAGAKGVRVWGGWLAACVLVVAFLGARFGGLFENPVPQDVIQARLGIPEGLGLHVDGATPGPPKISPDGKRVLFALRTGEGLRSIWVRDFDQESAREVPDTANAQYPFWSPDSRSIGFYSNGQLRRVTLVGGSSIALAPAENGKGGDWHENGLILYTETATSPLRVVSSSGGESREVTQLMDGLSTRSHRHPEWLPDGKHFLYVARDPLTLGTMGANTVWLGSIDGSVSRELLQSDTNVEYLDGRLLYVLGGTLLSQPFDIEAMELNGEPEVVVNSVLVLTSAEVGLFSSSEDMLLYVEGQSIEESGGMRWYDREGNEQGALSENVDVGGYRISPDGRYVIALEFENETSAANLMLYDLERGIKNPFTNKPGLEQFPVPTPDSHRVLFRADWGEGTKLYMQTVGGFEGAEVFLDGAETIVPTSWAPDGSELVGVRSDDGLTFGSIIGMPVDDPESMRVVIPTEDRLTNPQISPDGRWIAYEVNQGMNFHIEMTTYPTPGRRIRISQHEGSWVSWGSQSDELYYLGTDGFLCSVQLSETEDGTLVIAEPERLFSIGIAFNSFFADYSVSADGQRVLVHKDIQFEGSVPLKMILNWRQLAERRNER
ncbi:MAG: protein kinase domain-containing protein [Planctomycetota bacterium]|jgi:Tol biopolymer transport system component